jgi:Peptidase M50B-like
VLQPLLRRFAFPLLVIAALVIASLPVIGAPLQWLETYFHEISHALAALASGGRVVYFTLDYDGSGLAVSAGGWRGLVAFAGYPGAALWGLALFRFGLADPGSGDRRLMLVLAALVGLSWLLWGRGGATAVIVAAIVGVFAVARFAGRWGWTRGALRLIGVAVALNALSAPMALLGGRGEGDAGTLRELSYVPVSLWVGLWVLCAAATLYAMWRLSLARTGPR